MIMTERSAADDRVEITGVVSGLRRFCMTISPTNTRSHSTASLWVCGCRCVVVQGGGGDDSSSTRSAGGIVVQYQSIPYRFTLSALCHGMCIVLCPTASTRNPFWVSDASVSKKSVGTV